MRESRPDRFRRVVEARVNKIIKMVRLAGNCSNPAVYAFTQEQVQQIFLRCSGRQHRSDIPGLTRKGFRCRTNSMLPCQKYPTIVLPLPDGSSLRAVAIDDENFPAINVYWDTEKPEIDGPIRFEEYNPERGPCHEVCIGAYQSDKEDTVYYKPYMAERESNE